MTNEVFPADPFMRGTPTPESSGISVNKDAAEVRRQTARNADVIRVLTHEATAPVLDEEDALRSIMLAESSADYRDVLADKRPREKRIADKLALRREASASVDWSDLDRLAMRRAVAWIVAADGYGQGVTEDERADLGHDIPENMPATARMIIRRLADLIPAPDLDMEIFAASDALNGIRPTAQPAT